MKQIHVWVEFNSLTGIIVIYYMSPNLHTSVQAHAQAVFYTTHGNHCPHMDSITYH